MLFYIAYFNKCTRIEVQRRFFLVQPCHTKARKLGKDLNKQEKEQL
uniref:Uncharacterized protein n=1 Tax=Rhizophora mucronata TaxID=61149 RepID=A0A2P2NPL5_RHIMU